MKALSVRPHWAWLIIHGGKTFEQRSWRTRYRTRYRGPLYIHAGQKLRQAEFELLRQILEEDGKLYPPKSTVLAGGIIGLVELIDCIDGRDRTTRVKSPWFSRTSWNWQLSNPQPVPFRPMPGKLGLFHVK